MYISEKNDDNDNDNNNNRTMFIGGVGECVSLLKFMGNVMGM